MNYEKQFSCAIAVTIRKDIPSHRTKHTLIEETPRISKLLRRQGRWFSTFLSDDFDGDDLVSNGFDGEWYAEDLINHHLLARKILRRIWLNLVHNLARGREK